MTRQLASAWDRFWFAPQPTSTLALLRIWFGVLAFTWTIALAPDLGAFFSHGGLIPGQPRATGVWGVLGVFSSDSAVQLLFIVLVLACIALIAGFWTRAAAVIVFVGILSFERRNPYVFNSGDGLMRLIAFFLMLAPAGAALSIDRWRSARDRAWDFPVRPVWGLRLMQVQLSVVYLSTLWLKLQGTTWNDGTAVSIAQRLSDLVRFQVPGVFSDSALVSNVATWGTLLLEGSIPILIWNRRLRPYVIVAGVCLHLGIDLSIRVGFFSFAMFTLYLAFLEPDWAAQQVLRVRAQFNAIRQERRARRAPVVA
jgi:hypothetical protein